MTKYTVEADSGWHATLDGKQVLYCLEADDEAGYVLAPLIDADGAPIFNRSKGDYAVVRREGRVAVLVDGWRSPEERARIAVDNPFRIEEAREGELSVRRMPL